MSGPVRRQRAERAGRLAETASELLLRAKGFSVLGRRVRSPVGEIDLVMCRWGMLAFVEVKLRSGTGAGLEAVTPRGQARIVRAAQWWLARHPQYAGYTMRFDVVAWAPWSRPRHLAGAFEAR